MFNKLITTTLLLLSSLVMSSQASATLILEEYDSGDPTPDTIGGYTMTDFDFVNNTTSTDSVAAPGGGTVDFLDKFDNSLMMDQDTASKNSDWWVNGELFDYDIYTTSEHVVTLVLPEDTFAFSFNVGADLNSSNWDNAWLTATEVNGSGIENEHWFNVSSSNTPGFGIYADNSVSDCSNITSVTIDPLLWGFGNFSISRGSCASVPEPSMLLLMSTGFIGVVVSLLARRKRLLK